MTFRTPDPLYPTLIHWVQVLIAFAITAFITLCLSIYCLLVGHTNERRQTFNPVDRYVRKRISEPLRHFMHRKGFSPDLQSLVAYDLVNTFSDLQLVTGLAVLVAGFSELATGTISIYHSLIITDLAWFCTNSHLLSLAVTRSMRDSVKKTHPHRYSREHTETAARLVRALRITLMAATFAFLQIAFFGTGYKDMYNIEPNCPMKCTLSEPKGGRALRLMVTNMVLMAYFYAVQIFLTWRSGRIFWMDHIRGSLIDKQGQTVNILNPEVVFKQWTENRVLKTLKSTVLVVWYCLASEAGVLFGLTIYFVFGVYSLIDDRVRGHKKMDQKVHNEEDEVVYSQLVPIFVMIIPFMGIFESYARHSKAVREYEANELESRTSEGS
ncbi:hypothetical protein BDP55DRAFT_653374 [Colletotrichum godetiae]|uniref:Uncharacterized protein n=1 Tax=Colletotrichum godetiae TaxID=1209918 RepID=A0AAJ0EW49_9PEZI|nr:uncharacterized protein BDP55DRAFT_653374 [Colletotrichum godetiae]KAK1689514.1 hypothetical protein BDP55DRAFT_653374 [Colletotrichum godetiae]